MSSSSSQLLPTLKRYFGFSSFRPLQEAIILDALAGRDVFALLPTGGGKSLCFQLPALVRPGLTVVISPLIALMKDQVDALTANGAPATFLNSSLEPSEGRHRLRGLHNQEYRLLYVAPERLLLPGFLDDLARWGVHLIAVDEAHCISEWGHDFRPDYRQISQLRRLFPEVPLMALTATATQRVREDIIRLLGLRDPRTYVASFNRPNLSYRVAPKRSAYEQIYTYVRSRPNDSGIVYCQSRKTTEEVARSLADHGIPARAYHAGLSAEERSRHQELFLRDEVRVICATIAFGMGINKPNVRFVIHHDLPKNVEGYYQETGRAGRDGLPGDCLLLFSAGDVARQRKFIEEKPDPNERRVANEQLQRMVHYAETAECRRASLLDYFGEEFPATHCGGCDNCLTPRSTYDGTLAAQKLLSCVFRVREKSGFNVGLTHLIEVLTGADTEKIRRWGHQSLSTYGIGRESSRQQWAAVGRELLRRGLIEQSTDQFPVVQLTNQGRVFLNERRKIDLVTPLATPLKESSGPRSGDIACDEVLFEALREKRRTLANETGVPPYIVFSDVALRQMARRYPQREDEFIRISGVGEKKLREYGALFMKEIAAHLAHHPRLEFVETVASAAAESERPVLNETTRESLRRFRSGQPIPEIAQQRGLTEGTIAGHLVKAVESGEEVALGQVLSETQQNEVGPVFARLGWGNIVGVRDHFGDRYDYGVLALYRAIQRRAGGFPADRPTRDARLD